MVFWLSPVARETAAPTQPEGHAAHETGRHIALPMAGRIRVPGPPGTSQKAVTDAASRALCGQMPLQASTWGAWPASPAPPGRVRRSGSASGSDSRPRAIHGALEPYPEGLAMLQRSLAGQRGAKGLRGGCSRSGISSRVANTRPSGLNEVRGSSPPWPRRCRPGSAIPAPAAAPSPGPARRRGSCGRRTSRPARLRPRGAGA
jgi:hypothetical protein